MSDICPGSLVSGATGKKYKVDRIEGDFIYSGKLRIKRELILQVEPPPPIDRLRIISTLDKPEASEGLNDLLTEFSTDSIYEASLDLDTFPGIFLRRLLVEK